MFFLLLHIFTHTVIISSPLSHALKSLIPRFRVLSMLAPAEASLFTHERSDDRDELMDGWANNVSLNTSHTRETVGKHCIFIFKGCRLGPHKYYTTIITWLGYTCTHNNHYFFLQQLLVYKSWSMIIFLLIFTNFLDTSNNTTITQQ